MRTGVRPVYAHGVGGFQGRSAFLCSFRPGSIEGEGLSGSKPSKRAIVSPNQPVS